MPRLRDKDRHVFVALLLALTEHTSFTFRPSFSSGFTNFFRNKGSKAESKDKDRDKKHDSLISVKSIDVPLPVKSETSRVYTRPDSSRNSQAESPKSQRPDSSLSMTTPSSAIAVDTKVLAESPKILAPRASEESLDDEEAVKADTKTSGEMERSNSGKEDERSKSSKSSSPEEGEEGGETGASAVTENQGNNHVD